MSDNERVIERFYAAFGERDGDTMAACYAPQVTFWDPVFLDLRGHEAGAMWRMLTGQATDLRIELLEHEARDERGSAQWRAHCTFTQTGRPVVNNVSASLRFADGQIVEHRDYSTSTAGRARRSARPACCWAGRRSCETRSARARASLDEFLARDAASA